MNIFLCVGGEEGVVFYVGDHALRPEPDASLTSDVPLLHIFGQHLDDLICVGIRLAESDSPERSHEIAGGEIPDGCKSGDRLAGQFDIREVPPEKCCGARGIEGLELNLGIESTEYRTVEDSCQIRTRDHGNQQHSANRSITYQRKLNGR